MGADAISRRTPMLTVVAALVESDGKLLVCQRRRGSRFELMWEFPGGKVEASESPEEALARELREELGVAAQVGPETYRIRHKYDQMKEPLELIFLAASLDPTEVKNLEFEQITWCEPSELPKLNFLPADRELIEKLASGTIRLRRSEG